MRIPAHIVFKIFSRPYGFPHPQFIWLEASDITLFGQQ